MRSSSFEGRESLVDPAKVTAGLEQGIRCENRYACAVRIVTHSVHALCGIEFVHTAALDPERVYTVCAKGAR